MTLGGRLKHDITVPHFYFLHTRRSDALEDSFEDEKIGRGGVKIKEQVPVRLTGGILKTIHDKREAFRVRLLRQVANSHNITWVFEGHHVVRVQGNGSCVFPRRKQILRQIDACDVVVMRSFGEQIQDMLVLATITHQVVQHENTWSQMFREQALNVFRDVLHSNTRPSDGPIKSMGSGS